MFDVSFTELLLIGVVALVVIGPERLPKVARTVGHLLGRAQRYVSDVKTDIQKEMDLDELSSLKGQMEDAAKNIKSTISDASNTIRNPLTEAQDALKDAASSINEAASLVATETQAVKEAVTANAELPAPTETQQTAAPALAPAKSHQPLTGFVDDTSAQPAGVAKSNTESTT